MAIRFSIYYNSPEIGEHISQSLSSLSHGQAVESDTLENLPDQINPGLDVVFLEYQTGNPQLDRWIEKAAADRKNPPIFAILPVVSTEALLKAFRLGVKECVTHPFKDEELQWAVERLVARLLVEERLVAATRIISFVGSKGGVGTTFIVANLASLLTREHKKRVLVADLDVRYGQLKYFFDAKPLYTIIDLIENIERLDSSYFQSLVHSHDKNLHLLPAPNRIEEGDAVLPEHIDKILGFIKGLQTYPFILVDAGHRVDEVTLRALEMSDLVVLVTTPSIPALSNAKKLTELLHLLGVEESHLEFVLNSWEKKGDLAVSEVGKFLGRKIEYVLHNDPLEVARSINEGRPLAETAPRHPICRDLQGLLPKILGEAGAAIAAPRVSWLKRLFRRS